MTTFRTAAVIAFCVGPSAAFSIGPRLAVVWHDPTSLNAETVAFLILQTAATLVLAIASHHAGTAAQFGQRAACLALVAAVGILQFGAALDVAGHAQDHRAAGVESTQQARQGAAAALSAAIAARDALPADKRMPVTQPMVDAAREAVQAAEKSRGDECAKRGRFCRDREADERTARTAQADIEARFAIFSTIAAKQAELRQLGGEVPVDGRAFRFGRIIASLGFDIGNTDAERTAWVMDWWPTFQALVVELIAGLGPYALASKDVGEKPGQPRQFPKLRVPAWLRNRARLSTSTIHVDGKEVEVVETQPQADEVQESAAAVASAAVAGRRSKAAVMVSAQSVVEWHQACVTHRPGGALKPKETYEQAYLPWCQQQRIEPASFTTFGTTLKMSREQGGCGVAYQERNKRGFYVDVALVSKPALVRGAA